MRNLKGELIISKYHEMRVKDLKEILNKLPDEMGVVIPIVTEEDVNHILAFRLIRTAGILTNEGDLNHPEVLCLNGAADGQDIADQVYFSGRDVGVKEILYGHSNYTGAETKPTD